MSNTIMWIRMEKMRRRCMIDSRGLINRLSVFFNSNLYTQFVFDD